MVKFKTLLSIFRVAPGAHSIIGGINLFAILCFFSFAIIYLVLVGNLYMFVSNCIFGLLCVFNWYLYKNKQKIDIHYGIKSFVFLLIVDIGLINVVVHLGRDTTPMMYWGLSVPLAAAFIYQLPGVLFWSVIGVFFYPLSKVLHELFRSRTIPLSDLQTEILTFASYMGLLVFLAYSFFLFSRKLSNTLKELDNKNADIENILRVVCHDLGNPVTIIKYQIEKLKNIADTRIEHSDIREPIGDGCDKIFRSIKRISHLLKDVRDYTTLASGKIILRKENIDVYEALTEALSNLSENIEKKRIKVEINLFNASIVFDRENLVEQVFVNIISNAIKFSSVDGNIKIVIAQTDADVIVTVEDYGIGIPYSFLEKLFSVDSATNRPGTLGEKGTGLGLPIVKSYMDKYQAKITIVNKTEGSGAIVTLVWPQAKSTAG